LVKNGYVGEFVRGDDRELQISLRKDSDVQVVSAKGGVTDLEEEEEEEGYDVHEEYKEDSWRGKS